MANKKVQVDIVGDAKSYTKATDDAVKASQSMASKMKASVMQGLGMGAGFGIFGLMTKGIGMVTDALGDSVKAALADQASVERLSASLKANVENWDGTTDAIEENILAKQRLGFEDETLRDSLTILAGATHDVTKAQEIMNVAMDLARFKNIDLRTASEALIKVEGGHYRSLAQLGIKMKEGASQAEALAAVQKVAAGQAEAWAGTTEGKMAAASIAMGEAMESLGTALLPVVEGIATLAADTLPGFIDLMTNLGNSVAPVVGSAMSSISNAIDLVGDSFTALTNMIDSSGADWDRTTAAVQEQAKALGISGDAVLQWVEAEKLRKKAAAEAAIIQQQIIDNELRTQQVNDDSIAQQTILLDAIDAKRKAQGEAADTYMEEMELLRIVKDLNLDLMTLENEHALLTGEAAEQRKRSAAEQAALNRATAEATDILAQYNEGMKEAARTTLSAEMQLGATAGAADETTDSFEDLGDSASRVAESIRTDLSPLVGIVKGTLKEAKEEARAGMADLNWALTHPLAGEKLERFYRRKIRQAYAKLQEAQRTGNVDAIAKATALVEGLRSKLSELERVRISIQTSLDTRAENRSSGGRRFEYRAAGGPVSAGQPYIVGEKRAELFVPHASGTILPSVPMRQGGGSTVVNIYAGAGTDPTELGRVVTRALRSYGQAGGGPAMKAAIGVG